MAVKLRIQSLKNPDCVYDVVDFDKDTSTAKIQGRGASFTVTPFTKEKLAEDGYKLVQQEVPDAV